MGEDRCYSRHFVFHPEEAVFALTENRCSQVNLQGERFLRSYL